MSFRDSSGLAPEPANVGKKAGGQLAQVIATAGVWTAGQLADFLEWIFTGKTEHKASQGANKAVEDLLWEKDNIAQDVLIEGGRQTLSPVTNKRRSALLWAIFSLSA